VTLDIRSIAIAMTPDGDTTLVGLAHDGKLYEYNWGRPATKREPGWNGNKEATFVSGRSAGWVEIPSQLSRVLYHPDDPAAKDRLDE
jgi:hypothetical protein